ncbi:MAG: ABC transporter substrate-binding protein [Oligoflexia bacterium]|nr:ABC transporter substrate-binding protein [Oligoflexia bacterium]
MWKSRIFVIILTFVSVAAAEPPPTSAPLKVGLILPLTGPLAEYGVAFQNGVELARADSSEILSNCSFIVEDSKYDPRTAVGLLQKLTTLTKTPVVYNWGGPTSDAIAPLADRSNVALFVWSADPRVSEGHSQVVRFSNSGLDYGSTLARALVARGFKKVGIVKTDNQYIEAILSGLRAAGTTLVIEVVDNYLPTHQDFRATVSKLKRHSFDALGVFLLSGQVSSFVNQLKTQAIAISLFGTDFFESMTEVRQSNGGLIEAVFANNAVSDQFRAKYVHKFDNDLQINHAANGYDFANFICKQLGAQLAGLSPQQIIQKVSSVGSIIGEQGKAVFTVSGRGDKYFKFPVVLRRIEADRIVTESAG